VSAPGWLTLLALVLITSFGPWALPQMVQKFYSIRSTGRREACHDHCHRLRAVHCRLARITAVP